MSWWVIVLLVFLGLFLLSLCALLFAWWLVDYSGIQLRGESVYRDVLMVLASFSMFVILWFLGLYEVLRLWLRGGGSGAVGGESVERGVE